METGRRLFISLSLAGLALPAAARAQTATVTEAQNATWETPRAIGNRDAKITVEEWMSLTCTHCADFAQHTFPELKKNLIDTDKVRWVFNDFPLDQVALKAAMVARALPPNQYEPFIIALFNTQDRWAFAQGVNPEKALWDMAALAGMNHATFEAAFNDAALQNWILQNQKMAEDKYKIDATPTFVINGKPYPGEMAYSEFVKLLPGIS
jgi:protein-disulfide isomerase